MPHTPVSNLRFPGMHVQPPRAMSKPKGGQDGGMRILALHQQWYTPDVTDVVHCQHARWWHLAEQRQLLAHAVVQRHAAAACKQVWMQAKAAQDSDTVLRGFGLLLAHNADNRHEAHVHDAHVSRTDPVHQWRQ